MTFRSITAYRDVWGYWARDTDHSPLQVLQTVNDYEQNQFTQEFQLLGNAFDSSLSWVTGLYYFREEGTHLDVIELAGAVFDSGGSSDNTSYAAFAEATYDITDALAFTAGVRYSDETKKFTPASTVAQDNGLGIPAGTLVLPMVEGEQKTDEFNFRFNLAYRWTEDFMTYANFSDSFKGGGFTQRVFPPRPDVPAFEPEKAEAYEIGFKSELMDGRVRLNGAAFYTDYTNIQVNVSEATGVGAEIGVITRNAAAGKIKGVELETTIVPTDNLLIEGGFAYMDAYYTNVDGAALAAGLTKDAGFVNTPEWSINGSIAYSLDLSAEWTVTPRVDWSYRSTIYNDAENTALLTQEGYHLVNVSMRFQDADGLWTVTGGIKNLTDKTYLFTGYFDGGSGITEGAYARPREWYLSVKRNF